MSQRVTKALPVAGQSDRETPSNQNLGVIIAGLGVFYPPVSTSNIMLQVEPREKLQEKIQRRENKIERSRENKMFRREFKRKKYGFKNG